MLKKKLIENKYSELYILHFQMKEKVLAYQLFKDKKESYTKSVAKFFQNDRLQDSTCFKSLPKPKQDILNLKKFIQDKNEQTIVFF